MRTHSRRGFIGAAAVLAAGTTAPLAAHSSDAAVKPGYLITYGAGAAFLPGKPLNEQPLKEHLAYMIELHRKGVLRMAGGFADNSGGAAFIDAASLDEARSIAENDPAVTSKVFAYEVREWNLVPWQRLVERSTAG